MRKKEVLLTFNPEVSINKKGEHVRDGLSAAMRTGNNIWVACDERSTLERLTLLQNGNLGDHQSFDLGNFVNLPESQSGEVDIEGMALDGTGYLWVVGSHSLARKKPKKEDSPEKQISRLAKLKDDAKRYLLARIPLLKNSETGDYEPHQKCTHPTEPDKTLTAARLISSDLGSQLTEVLANDVHFRHFMKIPGKDNGFDIEGLATGNDRIFIGVRGPVLRGWAVILEIAVEDTSEGYFALKPDSGGKLYRKHFLHLDGMGIRDLRIVKDDLLILAGPTMDLDGTIAVYRWRKGITQKAEAIVHRKELERLFDVPHGSNETRGQDKAEGMALYDQEHVLIVFDTPTDARKRDESSVIADLYKLP